MPDMAEVVQELTQSSQSPVDLLGKYMRELHKVSGRNTILYSTAFLTMPGSQSGISLLDLQILMGICRGLPGPELDIVLHSPGGDIAAAASVVRYLRKMFTDIRVFVPLAAMSAATLWALSANRIVMGKHSQLGPIDPQILIPGSGYQPAQAILRQFDNAVAECSKTPAKLGAWLPMLQGYGPALLQRCEDADVLAQQLAAEFLKSYMFSGRPNAAVLAEKPAKYFSDSRHHLSHAQGIDRDQAKAQGLVIDDLESNQALQDAVLTVHHVAVAGGMSGAFSKVVANSAGKFFALTPNVSQPSAAPQSPPSSTSSRASAPKQQTTTQPRQRQPRGKKRGK